MSQYQAKMMNTAAGSIAMSYPFDAPEGLFERTSHEVVRRFFEHVDKDVFQHHADYEINAAFKNKHRDAATAVGSLILDNDAHLPFLLLISR